MLSRSTPTRLAKAPSCHTHSVRLSVSRPAQPAVRPAVQTRAADDGETAELFKDMQSSCEKFMQRYEHSMLSAGFGAAAVTTWCMVHGQSPGTAAAITVVSTITALVLNEVLFSDEHHSS